MCLDSMLTLSNISLLRVEQIEMQIQSSSAIKIYGSVKICFLYRDIVYTEQAYVNEVQLFGDTKQFQCVFMAMK